MTPDKVEAALGVTANKMPEMPEAPAGLKGWLSSYQQDLLREYIEMHGRSCYLAGIAAAKDALEQIANYSSAKWSDFTPEFDAAYAAVAECSECKRAEERKWPPSGKCEAHYCLIERINSREKAAVNHDEKYGPRNIARETLTNLTALEQEAKK